MYVGDGSHRKKLDANNRYSSHSVDSHGICHSALTTPEIFMHLPPQVNTLRTQLAKACQETGGTWVESLPLALMAMCNSGNRTMHLMSHEMAMPVKRPERPAQISQVTNHSCQICIFPDTSPRNWGLYQRPRNQDWTTGGTWQLGLCQDPQVEGPFEVILGLITLLIRRMHWHYPCCTLKWLDICAPHHHGDHPKNVSSLCSLKE